MKDFLARDCWEYRAQNARRYGRVSKLHGLFGVSVQNIDYYTTLTSRIISSIGQMGSSVGSKGIALCLHQRSGRLPGTPFVWLHHSFQGLYFLTSMCRSMQLLLGPGLLAVEGESLPSWVSYITDAIGITFRGATQTAAQDADTRVLYQTFA